MGVVAGEGSKLGGSAIASLVGRVGEGIMLDGSVIVSSVVCPPLLPWTEKFFPPHFFLVSRPLESGITKSRPVTDSDTRDS